MFYAGNRYDLLSNNCNHFAHRMAQMLNLTDKFPYKRIFRITDFWNQFRCCIPDCILSGRLDWFISPEEHEMEESLHERLSMQKEKESLYDKYSLQREMSQKYVPTEKNSYKQLVEEEADDVHVREYK